VCHKSNCRATRKCSETYLSKPAATSETYVSQALQSVFLVGGFAASNWLFTKLKDSLEPFGLTFCRPDSHVYVLFKLGCLMASLLPNVHRNKAVADGAVSFYLDHFVGVRVSKLSYGIDINSGYDPSNTEHARRSSTAYVALDGHTRIPNCFDVILPKVREKGNFNSTFQSPLSLPEHAGI
jgi:hypothetical protein